MLLDWSDDYALGITKIDEQHKGFFDLVRRLYDECLMCEGERVIPETLEFLGDYVRNHFRGEEELMRRHAYPGVDEHAQLHVKFLEKFAELVEEFNTLGASEDLAEETAEMVQNWLVDHIAEVDTQYAKHIEQAT
ncbi:MAG: hemerythrin family protein [Planctomycetes bacterium]|nr:hemerythrin family protein [Planctomycetota bacterium]